MDNFNHERVHPSSKTAISFIFLPYQKKKIKNKKGKKEGGGELDLLAFCIKELHYP